MRSRRGRTRRPPWAHVWAQDMRNPRGGDLLAVGSWHTSTEPNGSAALAPLTPGETGALDVVARTREQPPHVVAEPSVTNHSRTTRGGAAAILRRFMAGGQRPTRSTANERSRRGRRNQALLKDGIVTSQHRPWGHGVYGGLRITLRNPGRDGAPEWTRTTDRRIRNPMLYPTELRARAVPLVPRRAGERVGRGDGTRTHDSKHPKLRLYQLRYSPRRSEGARA